MKYKHLNYQKRYQILAFWKAGYTQRNIAKEIGVHKSRISRELNHNITFIHTKLESWQYKPDYAQGNAHQRHKEKNKFIKFTNEAKTAQSDKSPLKIDVLLMIDPLSSMKKRESVIGKLIP